LKKFKKQEYRTIERKYMQPASELEKPTCKQKNKL